MTPALRPSRVYVVNAAPGHREHLYRHKAASMVKRGRAAWTDDQHRAIRLTPEHRRIRQTIMQAHQSQALLLRKLQEDRAKALAQGGYDGIVRHMTRDECQRLPMVGNLEKIA